MRFRRTTRGSALLIALVFVAVFGVLAFGYLTAASANLKAAQMQLNSRRAQLAAESGLAFVRRALPLVNVQHTAGAAQVLQAIATGLNSQYQNTIFGGRTAVVDGNSVVLPALVLNFPSGPAEFQARVLALSDTNFQARSSGASNQCVRNVASSFLVATDRSLLTTFGVASKSKITMIGNAKIRGAGDPMNGSILSATQSSTIAIDLTGNCDISGNVSISNPHGEVRMVGNPHIGGEVRIGVSDPQFPEIDGSIFVPYATNTVGPTTPVSGNRYFENIRILANANPTFNGNTTIHGVVYIESPNRVTFAGNLNITGVVIVQPPSGSLDLANHYLKFTGNVVSQGVNMLPASPQFDGLRNLTGSFVLARGYDVEFAGNFGTVNGSMVGSKMGFTGNASGTVNGSILNYDDTNFEVAGNTTLTINRDNMDENPAGIIFPRIIGYVPGTYNE